MKSHQLSLVVGGAAVCLSLATAACSDAGGDSDFSTGAGATGPGGSGATGATGTGATGTGGAGNGMGATGTGATGATSTGATGTGATGTGATGSGGAPVGGSSPGGSGSGGAAVGGSTSNGAVTLESDPVATWKNDATAAYSVMHDDICDWDTDPPATGGRNTSGVFHHWDEASSRGFNVSWGPISKACWDTTAHWNVLQAMTAAGDEVFSHTVYHCDQTMPGASSCMTWSNEASAMVPVHEFDPGVSNGSGGVDVAKLNDKEFTASKADLEAGIGAGYQVAFFGFPLDAFDDALLTKLKSFGYLGARGGVRNSDPAGQEGLNPADVNVSDPLFDFRVTFDAWKGEDTGVSRYGVGAAALKAYVDNAVTHGKWAVRELHGIEDGSWGSVPLATYQAHLDYVKGLVDAGSLWVATPTTVVKYRRSRYHCGAPTLAGSTLAFSGAADASCQAYATPVSVLVTASQPPTVTQGGAAVEVVDLGGGRYALNVDPSQPATVN